MSIREELAAAAVNPDDPDAVIAYIAALPIPRDRREGYLRLYLAGDNKTPTLAQIERVRAPASP